MNILNQAKDLLSHVVPDGNWAEVFTYLAGHHVRKVQGKASCVARNFKSARNIGQTEGIRQVTQSFLVKPILNESKRMPSAKRKAIKITTRRKILDHANHCCEYVDPESGNKCQSTYQLQIDHRTPVALGGTNEENNLRTLCRTHNLLSARKWGLQ